MINDDCGLREKFVDSYNSSSTHDLISNGKGLIRKTVRYFKIPKGHIKGKFKFPHTDS